MNKKCIELKTKPSKITGKQNTKPKIGNQAEKIAHEYRVDPF